MSDIRLSSLLGASYYSMARDVFQHNHTHYDLSGGRGSLKSTTVSLLVPLLIVQHSDTPGISDEVFLQLPRSIIKAKSTEIDTISGATFTSRGVLEAVNDALQKSMR